MSTHFPEKDHFNKVRKFHDLNADEYTGARYGTETVIQMGYLIRRDITLNMLGALKGKLLDVGCGPGTFSTQIAGKDRTIYSSDISFKMLKKAKDLFDADKGAIYYFASNLADLGVRDVVFDGIICIGVIGYIPDLSKALCELYRVMKPGAIAVIQTSNSSSARELLYEKWVPLIKKMFGSKRKHGFGFDFPLYAYGKKQFDRKLKESGFQIMDWSYYELNIPFIERVSGKAAVLATRWLQRFAKHKKAAFLGSGYLVKVKKP